MKKLLLRTFCPNIHIYLVLLILLPASNIAFAENTWNASVNENNGLLTISKGGGNAVISSFVFFGKDYSWADQETNFKITSPGQYVLSGNNKSLGFGLDAKISKVTDHQINWEFEFDAKNNLKDVIGGGISFKFDIDRFSNELGEPDILSDNSGWGWGKGANRIEMRFKPKLPDLHFERGNKRELRAYFYSENISAGKLHYTVTLSLAGNIAVAPTVTERFGLEDSSKWPRNIMSWETSPIDLSFLNEKERPAGKHGFVKTKGDQLIFEDGAVAKFWGTNITSYTLFHTPKDMVKTQAKRLSALGFNLVRLHHHDSPWVEPNIFGNKKSNNTKYINTASIEKLDWWVKCLKDEGIYVWLDMHVERQLKSGDGIYAFDEISKGKSTADMKGYNYVNTSIQQAMRQFNADYLNHINIHTKTAYKDEPAIAAILITNENDVTNHFGNSLLPDKNVDQHSDIYMMETKKFAKANNLSADKTWRSWEHGPSKLFLNNLEHNFNKDMMSHLRSLGVKVPIVTTSTWGGNSLSSLPALTTGDIIDAHAYQEFGALEKNPLISPNLTHWLAAAQVIGKPMSVTEWSAEPFPTPDRHTLPLYVAGQASFQGWDAMMQFAYSQISLRDAGRPSNWDTFNDPSVIATMPVAALMYRRGDLKEANTTYVLNPGNDALFNQNISPENSTFIRTATELGKLVIAIPAVKELPWLQKSNIPANAKVVKDPNTSLIGPDSTEASSDTGELKHNWNKGNMSINTPNTQAVMGWIGGDKFTLADIEVSASTRNATIAVQSMDSKPINQSKNLTITLAARSLPKTEYELPFRSEPVEGHLQIKAPKGLKLFKHHLEQKKEIPVTYKNGQYSIALDKTLGTYWLSLTE